MAEFDKLRTSIRQGKINKYQKAIENIDHELNQAEKLGLQAKKDYIENRHVGTEAIFKCYLIKISILNIKKGFYMSIIESPEKEKQLVAKAKNAIEQEKKPLKGYAKFTDDKVVEEIKRL